MRAMRYLLLVFLLLPSCAILKGLQDSAENTAKITGKVDKALDKVDQGLVAINNGVSKIAEAKAAADTNKDGKTDGQEWLLWLLGAGGGTGLLGFMRRNAKSDERKAIMETRLAAVEAKA